MATVNGYDEGKMLPIENSSLVHADIVGDDLVLTSKGGTPVNAGNVRGPKGPTGPAGDGSLTDLANKVAEFDYGPWYQFPLAANWANLDTVNWRTARYRRNNYRVELDGMLWYTGAPLAAGSIIPITTALAANYRPAYRQMFGGWFDAGQPRINAWIETTGVISTYITGGTLPTNAWISFGGHSYSRT